MSLHIHIKTPLSTDQGWSSLRVRERIDAGSFFALYGRTGVGKTTLLRMLAGLDDPGEGRIEAFGERWSDTAHGISLSPQKRKVGMVFQDQALFPNMTVEENVRFPGVLDRHERKRLLEGTALAGLRDRYPGTLSGGQRQRVALARVLALRPRLLLLDEPLSAVDRDMRATLQDLLWEHHRRHGMTTLLVSHDIPEIQKLADEVGILGDGRMIERKDPRQFSEMSGGYETERIRGTVIGIREGRDEKELSLSTGHRTVDILLPRTRDDLKEGDRVTIARAKEASIVEKESLFN